MYYITAHYLESLDLPLMLSLDLYLHANTSFFFCKFAYVTSASNTITKDKKLESAIAGDYIYIVGRVAE